MSHCTCCDKTLSTFEMTRKNKNTGEYFMMCNECFSYVKPFVNAIERKDLATSGDFDDDVDKAEVSGYFNNYIDDNYKDIWEDR